MIGRKFDITEYGVCFTEDLLDDIPESVVKVRNHYTNIVDAISIYSVVDLYFYALLLMFALFCFV